MLTHLSKSPTMSQRRAEMVEQQLRSRGLRDERLLAAMSKVPREAFILGEDIAKAYGDFPLPIGAGQTISQPYIVATMIETLQVRPADRVLEIGTGTGYQSAILGELATEVWTIERHPELAEKAREILVSLGYQNVHVAVGDGSLGMPQEAPFDRILVAAAAPKIPDALVVQLADEGRLVIPVGTRTEQQVQMLRKHGNELSISVHDLCRFVPLVGEGGWNG